MAWTICLPIWRIALQTVPASTCPHGAVSMAHAVFSDTLGLGLFNLSTKAEGFLPPPGSGSQINTPSLLLCTLLNSPCVMHQAVSPRPEEGTWCLQATTDSQHREGLGDILPISVTGEPACIEVSPWCGLGPVKSLLSTCWHCPSKDSPCVWKLSPLVCSSSLGGLLCQGRSPVPSGFCLRTWRGVQSMPASHGPIKIFRC